MTMYHQHFQLDRSPFSIAPDPSFLYMSERHREALAHLKWGLSGAGGFVLLTGEVGTGKTTLCRCLLEQIPDDTDVAFVINPRVTVTELLTTICEELGDAPPESEQGSVKKLVDRINRRLMDAHAAGKRVVLVIDEAQNLAVDVLEQVRLLTNLETNERKLLQVILLGQPELGAMLEAPELRQLAQRVTARYHLLPLSADELAALVHHRLTIAGARRNPFTAGALQAIHARSGGIPRVANVIADRALLGAYAEGSESVSAAVVRRAAAEVLGGPGAPGTRGRRALTIAAGVALLISVGAGLYMLGRAGASPGPAIAASAPATVTTPTERGPAERGPAAAVTGSPAAASPTSAGPAPAAAAPVPQTTLEETAAAPPIASPAPASPRPEARVATAAGAAPAEPPTAASRDLPELEPLWADSLAASRLAAARALLEAWYAPVPMEPGPDPCDQVAAAGLRCLEEQGSWPTLVTLDRPAILELWRPGSGEARHVALLAADDTTVTVSLDGTPIELPRAALDGYWRGRATVFWQMPPGYSRPSRRGDDDVTSAWLAERLALLDGVAEPDAVPGRFDAALEDRVRVFQLRAGLSPDGIVGARTWMRLNDETGVGTPTLASP